MNEAFFISFRLDNYPTSENKTTPKVPKSQGFWEHEERPEDDGSRRCHATEDGARDDGSTMMKRPITYRKEVQTRMSFWTMRTFSEDVTDHGEIGKTEIGGNQEDRENVGKSRVSAVEHSLKFTPISHFWRNEVYDRLTTNLQRELTKKGL